MLEWNGIYKLCTKYLIGRALDHTVIVLPDCSQGREGGSERGRKGRKLSSTDTKMKKEVIFCHSTQPNSPFHKRKGVGLDPSPKQ